MFNPFLYSRGDYGCNRRLGERMILALALMAAVAVPVAEGDDRSPGSAVAPVALSDVAVAWREEAAQVRVTHRIIIRVPRRENAVQSMLGAHSRKPGISFAEKRMGRCIPVKYILAMHRSSEDSLDFHLAGDSIVRAYLDDDCSARDFYSGLYIERPKDSRLCAERDLIHARSGAKCEIEKFRRLVPTSK